MFKKIGNVEILKVLEDENSLDDKETRKILDKAAKDGNKLESKENDSNLDIN